MKAYHRIFAAILALLLVCPLLPGEILSPFVLKAHAFSGGNGLQSSPYQIASEEDFIAMKGLTRSFTEGFYFVQTTDIWISPATFTGNYNDFYGDYNGQGYTITVTQGSTNRTQYSYGLFPKAINARIRNLNVYFESLRVDAAAFDNFNNHRGGIVGWADNTTVQNCSVDGLLTVVEVPRITNSSTKSVYSFVGGIVGMGSGAISGCYSSLELHVGKDTSSAIYMSLFVGGIVGHPSYSGDSTVENCLFENGKMYIGKVDGGRGDSAPQDVLFAGGIVGLMWARVTIRSCVFRRSTIMVTSGSIHGGAAPITGLMGNGLYALDSASNMITNCYMDSRSSCSSWPQPNYAHIVETPTLNSSILPQKLNNFKVYDGDCSLSTPTAAELNAGSTDTPWVGNVYHDETPENPFTTTLRWRALETPVVSRVQGPGNAAVSSNATMANGHKIVLTPTFSSDQLPGISSGVGVNQIRYELKYTTIGQLPAPIGSISGNILTLSVLDEASAMIPDATIEYSPDNGLNYSAYPSTGIEISTLSYNVNQASILVRAAHVNYTPSAVRTITVTKGAASLVPPAPGSGGDTRKLGQPSADYTGSLPISLGASSLQLMVDSDSPADTKIHYKINTSYAAEADPGSAAGYSEYSVGGIDLSQQSGGNYVHAHLRHANADIASSGDDRVFRVSDSDGEWKLVGIVPSAAAKTQPARPTASVTANQLTLATSTAGAAIWYGTDENNMTTEYTAPFDVSAGGTYYAVARLDGMESNIAMIVVVASVSAVNGTTDEPAPSVTRTFTNSTGADDQYVGRTTENVGGTSSIVLTIKQFSEIKPSSAIELICWYEGKCVIRQKGSFLTTGASAAPVITPDRNGTLGNGVTISTQSGSTVFYTITRGNKDETAAAAPDPDTTMSNTNGSNGKRITGSLTISSGSATLYESILAFTEEEMTIKAISRATAQSSASTVTTVTYGVDNKPRADPPVILIGGIDFNKDKYYSAGDSITFEHAELADGTIYYTTDSTSPLTSASRKSYESLADAGTLPAPSADSTTVMVQAVLIRDNYPASSSASATVKIKTQHGAPLFSIENNRGIGKGSNIRLTLRPSDYPEELRPDFYIKEGGDPQVIYDFSQVQSDLSGSYYGVKEIIGNNAYVYSTQNLPAVKYQRNGGETLTYSLSRPEIRYYDNQEKTSSSKDTVQAYLSPGFTVDGEPGTQVTVKAWLEKSANSAAYDNGSPVEYIYTFFARTNTPVAVPSMADAPTVNIGDAIMLTAKSGAQIFYALGGGTPSVAYDSSTGKYSPAPDSGTLDYTGVVNTGIMVTGTQGGYFIISAMAVESGMSYSEIATYTYRIADMSTVATPIAWPATSSQSIAAIERGSTITLTSATTSADIFYSTRGAPVVTANSADGSFSPGNQYTQLYDAANGLEVTGTPGSNFVFYAAAYKDGMKNSEVAAFTYKIADLPVAAAPTASPATSDSSVTTLPPGSKISMSTATVGAQIYYSTSGGTPTQLYSDQNGITIQGDAGTFFTVTAIAKKSGMTDSPEVAFRYQLPAPVQAVYATPGEGTVVKDTEVTLATTTAGATIYYETATRESALNDPVPNESQVYTKPIKIGSRTYITAIAVKDGVESIITEYEYKVASQVSAPEPSIPSGSIVAKGTKVTFTTTSGASIAYTKDGSDPADSENKKRMFGSEIAIDAEEGKSVSISLYATKTGMTPSEVVSVSYTVSKADEVLTANPPANSTVKPGDRITLSTSVSGAEIHYTTDGSDPTKESPKGSTVTVEGTHGETFVVRAIAATDSTATTPAIFSYKILPRTPAPSASIPNGAIILEGAEVVLTAPEGNIYYTTDGSDPTTSSQMYTEAFELTGSAVLKAIAIADGKAQSETAEYIYTMAGQVAAPTASQPSGTIDVGSKITLSTTTEDAIIYYTTNGVNPTADNLRDCFTYESPITISRPVSIRMFAVRQGMNASVVNTVTYTVAEPPPETAEEPQELTTTRDSDRLFLFDQFVDSGEGPLYEDIVLRDALTLTVVSAQHGALPDNVQLMVERMKSPPAEDIEAVRRALDHFSLASLYDITLLVNGEAVQPVDSNLVEVGLPIPDGYEDGVALLCLINENGTVMTFPTRRSGGMLYVSAPPHFSKYGVAVPALPGQKQSWWKPWYLWLLAAVIATAGAAALIVITKRKKEEVSK